MQGYRELRESAAQFDLSGRGLLSVTGEDRKRLLHALSTNHIQQLTPGQGCYAFFLNAQGRILFDANILCREDDLLLDVADTAPVLAHLDHYIIADDVTLTPLAWRQTAVEGPAAEDTLRALLPGLVLPAEPYSVGQQGPLILARLSYTGAPGFRIFSPEPVPLALPQASPDAVEAVRLEHGTPLAAMEFTGSKLPQETRLDRALHFQKGCYLGQEIVERIRSRGHVNRWLVPLRAEGREAFTAGAPLTLDGAAVGEITSSAYSPAEDRVNALGYVRVPAIKPDNVFTAEGRPVRLRS